MREFPLRTKVGSKEENKSKSWHKAVVSTIQFRRKYFSVVQEVKKAIAQNSWIENSEGDFSSFKYTA